MNWLSIVILVILAGCILNGFRKGMVRTLAAMMSLVVSLVLVSLANPYVATFLEEKTTVYEVTETKCREAFQSIAEKTDGKCAAGIYAENGCSGKFFKYT